MKIHLLYIIFCVFFLIENPVFANEKKQKSKKKPKFKKIPDVEPPSSSIKRPDYMPEEVFCYAC